MAGSQIEQWNQPELQGDPGVEPAATAAAITLAPMPGPLPRPRWQRRLAIAAAIGALGSLGGLLLWVFRPAPHPYV
ncbi:MAG: hypothetical protein DCF21_13620, partial [Leptolyngbya sp.]